MEMSSTWKFCFVHAIKLHLHRFKSSLSNSLPSWMNSLPCYKLLHAFLDVYVVFPFLLLNIYKIAWTTFTFWGKKKVLRRVSYHLRLVLYFAPNQHNLWASWVWLIRLQVWHSSPIIWKNFLISNCIEYLSCADENGHKFGERTELIKKLSGKLQNYQKLYSIILLLQDLL